MKILVYRYGSICEPDVIEAFKALGLEVLEETTEITAKRISDADRAAHVEKILKEESPLFVFSINFYPVISKICKIYHIRYLCWTVDSPVPELFSEAIRCPVNRIFLFDRAQLDYFSAFQPQNLYHLPLASCTERFDKVISGITDEDRRRYAADISFVGSLYSEKNPLHDFERSKKNGGLSDYSKGYIRALTEAALKVYGYNPVPDAMADRVAEELKAWDDKFYRIRDCVASEEALCSYIAAHSYVGMQIAETERIRTLNTLARFFDVDLFTRSDTAPLQDVHVHGGVETLTEMPKIFHLSKINLNMTVRPIQTGLPLRIFDILGCGGFLMTNFQEEIPEYFEIGTDVEAYTSMEELVDKCAYYLEHEDERRQISENGYRKVCEKHRYVHRLKEMIAVIAQEGTV